MNLTLFPICNNGIVNKLTQVARAGLGLTQFILQPPLLTQL